ncbi:MAG: Na(+)-translocating NADH-quinone reductase subunit A [Prevotella sp.]|nr:Na(+)-translocating NADH-quinone reductase subunit A [Prevotella sp.]MDY5666301.1 Na(+)-translocating NADH-quinone reductase subunit A [Alloprevotella sp.]
MRTLYKIKKGLDLTLKGEATEQLTSATQSAEYAVMPTDFPGIVPRAMVKEGDSVLAGQTLFVDKATERIHFVSPVSGTIVGVERGERRKLLRFRVKANETQEFKNFDVKNLAQASADDVKNILLESGIFAFMRQRPYDVIANPNDTPKAIFISTFSKMPLAANFSFVAKGMEQDFKLGVRALARIAKVHIGICPEQINSELLPIEEAEVSVFDGPNPSGNVGVHINHVSPVNKGEVVWTMGAEMLVVLGRLLRTGKLLLTRRIAVAGACIKAPQYVETIMGAPLADLLKNQLSATEHVRIINGNPFVGYKSNINDFLGAFSTELCAIPEGDNVNEAFGWIAPRLNDFSTSRSYFSWLLGKKHAYNLDCRIKGGERHMIMSAEYERVFPMDIYPSYLIKAIITGDIDRQEALGIYEVAPEDFAVAEFIDSSKLELQRIVREGLDVLRKENA